MDFKKGDRVRNGDDLGVVTQVSTHGTVYVTFKGDRGRWKAEYNAEWFKVLPNQLEKVEH